MWSVIPACLARSFAEPVSVILSPFCRLTLLFSVKSAAELICVLPLAVFTVTSPAAVNAPFAPTRVPFGTFSVAPFATLMVTSLVCAAAMVSVVLPEHSTS